MPKNLLLQSNLDRTLAALSEPTRRRLLERLGSGGQRASDACRGMEISRPAISKHLGVLRRAGLIEVVPRGRERIYRLARRPSGLVQARVYLEGVSSMWDRALKAFKNFAETEMRR